MAKAILLTIILAVISTAVGAQNLLTVEQNTRADLNRHTFKRDVTLQTIGRNNEVTGEYKRTSVFTLSDAGARVEQIISESKDTITEMKITKEDFQDLNDAQMLGIDDADKYVLTPVEGSIDGMVEVTPRQTPDAHYMGLRYFTGNIWINSSGQIVRVRGRVEPSGKQRFPWFDTFRENVGAPYPFPVRTVADDVLHFPARDVHYRIEARYYDYKRFGVSVEIKELDPVGFLTRVDEGSPVSVLPTWPKGSVVGVMATGFNPAQVVAIQNALALWNNAEIVRFEYRAECDFCIVITRKDVVGKGRHLAYFVGRVVDGKLVSGRIDVDVRTVKPEAVQSVVAHELGHAAGLGDCRKCDSVMRNFKHGPNGGNGHYGPTEVDLKALRP